MENNETINNNYNSDIENYNNDLDETDFIISTDEEPMFDDEEDEEEVNSFQRTNNIPNNNINNLPSEQSGNITF